MLPRLMAEETLDLITAISVGNGTLKKNDSRRIMNAYRRDARSASGPKVQTIKEAGQMLELVGITKG